MLVIVKILLILTRNLAVQLLKPLGHFTRIGFVVFTQAYRKIDVICEQAHNIRHGNDFLKIALNILGIVGNDFLKCTLGGLIRFIHFDKRPIMGVVNIHQTILRFCRKVLKPGFYLLLIPIPPAGHLVHQVGKPA